MCLHTCQVQILAYCNMMLFRRATVTDAVVCQQAMQPVFLDQQSLIRLQTTVTIMLFICARMLGIAHDVDLQSSSAAKTVFTCLCRRSSGFQLEFQVT